MDVRLRSGEYRKFVAAGLMMMTVEGCIGRYVLDRKPVRQIAEAERKSRGRMAFEGVRERMNGLREGMSPEEVQAVLGAVIAVEDGPGGEGGGGGRQRKLMDGFLCKMNPMPLRERWLFGYDEGNLQLVGFVVEFERRDEYDDELILRRVDHSPEDDCPGVGDTHLE